MSNEIKTLVISEQTLPVIRGNFEEVKSALKETLSKYSNIVCSEETVPDCKSMQKELSRIRRNLDGSRLDVKREIAKPIDEFDRQMKELLCLVAEVEDPIKKGLKVFDDKRIEEKLKEIEGIIEKLIAETELPEKYAAQIEFDPKWSNKGITTNAVAEEIKLRVDDLLNLKKMHEETAAAIEQTVRSANTMHNLNSPLDAAPYITQVIDKGWELPKVMKNINVAAENRAKAENAAVETHEAKKTELVSAEPSETSGVRTVAISVTTTETKFKELAQFMKASGIAFEKINLRQ